LHVIALIFSLLVWTPLVVVWIVFALYKAAVVLWDRPRIDSRDRRDGPQ
jgi:hypothetical protein